ncbi:hypothetical protein ARHIZOSPH14_27540 [Agromyces rhizosphaerae]|uniref:Ribbon-helix-helix protein, CopG family n=1 Tax=Agromyces rhizosphaerae TaxID=88374 RepID=A0A9W6CXM6_9MICO|nr:hypothetical protein [Agromyces rhizosphaerae]GLI28512.1 hypothetical protein ARHIZOSPH14_27540 [Agromyces rhizosphaerae]
MIKYELSDDTSDEPVTLPDGTVLDGEAAEEFADGLLDRVAAQHPNLIPGRKSLSGGGKHSPTLHVRVPEDVYARLEAVAEVKHVRISQLVRDALDGFLSETAVDIETSVSSRNAPQHH